MQTKPWYKSRLIAVGLLEIVGAGIAAAMQVLAEETDLQTIILTIAFAVVGSATMFLRADTTKGLTK